MTSESLDPELLKKATEAEVANLDPAELASDGGEVVVGIAPPSDDELLAHLEARGWTSEGPPSA